MAVKAKVERLGSRPRFSISARIVLFELLLRGVGAPASSLSASSRVPGPSTALRLLVLSPDCEEWASSTMTAKRLPGQLADLLGDHRELLQRGDDDRLARLQRLLELAGGGVDVLDHAERLLELAHRALELAVEHAAVGDDDDRVEDAPVLASCRVESWWASQAMVKLLPLPAECWIR